MIWPLCWAVTLLVAAFLVGSLAQRRIRQARTAAGLAVGGPNGVAEECYVRIGGIEQWIGIRGENRDHPILLLVHGGPGSSYSIFTPLLRAWERHFTVVQWDQRGCARTFARTGRLASGRISMEQLTLDGIEVAEYLRRHLRKERLFLLASSFGSTFGLEMVRRRPDLFYAYVGTDQNVGMARGREESHDALLRRLRAAGLEKGARAIERIGSDPSRWNRADFSAVTEWTMKSDPKGYRRTMRLLKDAVWFAPGWRLRDIWAFVAGMRFSLEQLLPEFLRFDAWQQGTRFEVPFFILQGEDDVLTTPQLATAFYNDVVAPLKEMRMVADAGHFAAFLQPERFLDQLLTLVRPLADDPH